MKYSNISKKLVTYIPLRDYLRLSREALWVFSDQAGTALAGLLGVKILTHFLSPGEFGRLALANTIVGLVGTNLFVPLGQGIMRFWSISKNRGDLSVFYAVSDRYSRYAVGITFVLTLIVAVSSGLVRGINWAILPTLSLIVGAIMGWLGLRISIFTAARKRRQIALLNICNAFLRPALAAFLIILVASDAIWAMVGYLFATALILLIAERHYRHIVLETSSSASASSEFVLSARGMGKDIFSFSLPFLIWGIFSWIYMSCDRWSLQTFYGAEVVGAFAAVSQLAMYPLIFGSAFLHTLFTPIVFQSGGDLTNRQNIISANRLLGIMTSIYIFGAVILITLSFLFHYQLVLLISNARYAEFSFLLPWLTIAWGLFFLGQVLSTFGILANSPQIYIKPKLASSLLAGISTFYLVSKMGPVGVVLGLGIAGSVYALWCMIIAWKVAGGLQKEGLVNTA